MRLAPHFAPALLLALLAPACGAEGDAEDPCTPLGGADTEPAVVALVENDANGGFLELRDGGEVHLQQPLQGGHVIYVGARVTGLCADSVMVTGRILDATTGEVRWSFQTTPRAVWDYDIGSQPVLVDLPSANGMQRALLAPTKVGEIFLLDRATGRPLAEVAEKPVPQDPVPGERLSPTQPFSVGMPSFTPPDLREASMWGASPLDQLWCRIEFRRTRYDGLYTPITTQRTIAFPSPMGTIDWGSVAVDPERRVMIVNSTGVPFIDRLIPRDEARTMGIRPYSGFDPKKPGDASSSHLKSLWAQDGTPYAVEFLPFLSPLKIPCHQPPWGEIAAVDLDTRRTLWRRPLGNTRDHALLGLPFPTGMLNLGGAVVTRGGVAFIAATADHYLRAFDVETGAELWRAGLPAGGQANPMTYVSRRSGRQYVVIAAGGHGTLQTRPGDYVMAYALPKQ